MSKKSIIPIILIILLIPLTTLAQSDGIPLQKDVWFDSIPNLQSEIRNHMDLPDQITFNLYDSKTALTPIATQTFPKGKYTVDFEFSKSDGFTPGTVAKFKAQEGRHR